MECDDVGKFYRRRKYDTWESDDNYRLAKEKILAILVEQQVSLSQAHLLFDDVLDDIERKNPVTKF